MPYQDPSRSLGPDDYIGGPVPVPVGSEEWFSRLGLNAEPIRAYKVDSTEWPEIRATILRNSIEQAAKSAAAAIADDPPSDVTRMAQKQACINEATERFRLASAAIADIVPTDRDVEAWRDWFRRQVVMARLADALHTFDLGATIVGSPEWFRNQVAMARAHTSRIYVTMLEHAAETAAVCLLEPVVKASDAAIADDIPSDGKTSPDRPPHSDVDTVIDSLSRDGVNRADRGRLGDALGKADARADGHKAGAGEAFGRIAGR